MAHKTNSIERFWQELKRRKVFGVVTTYAATAYIIIEVTNNLVEPLSLPAWIAKLVILLLVAGLPIVVILSWIFDFTSQGLTKTVSLDELERKKAVTGPLKRRQRASYVLNAILIMVVMILVYPKIFKRSSLEGLRSSGEKVTVAIMPFQNMTNDTIWNVWQDGIQNELITSLTNSEELKVRQTESITSIIHRKGLANYAAITPSVARSISQKLDANVFVCGSIKQAGTTLRISAQLIDTERDEIFKSFLVEGAYKEDNLFHLIDSLSDMLNNFLIISEIKKDLSLFHKNDAYTGSPEAFRYFIYGRNAFYLYDYPTARNWLLQAISIDSNYIDAIQQLSLAYRNQFLFDQMTKSYGDELYLDQAKKWCLKAYEKQGQMSPQQKIKTFRLYAMYFETPVEEINWMKQLLNFDDQNPNAYYGLGSSYYDLLQFEKAIPEYEKALEIYKKWGVKPDWIFNYTYLGDSYHNTGMYKEEENLYKKAEQDFPDDPNLILNQLVLSWTVGDTITFNRLTEKGASLMKSLSISRASIASITASAYSKTGALDKAEEYYRQALSFEPESPVRLNDLGYFLIDEELDIEEGLKLADKALELKPDYYSYLHTIGWGLYKQGKYREALATLQKSWDLRRLHAIYDHSAYLHLEAAKKAVAGMK